ncbi:hypothetical protein V6N11_065798 [Hibiscus sabdariffa]|uniref:Retrovirus-related Pol polyprotein from transposon TNT 1-94-like beta-barrel domain-containing protein n=1 Tax=Hibiscus sabdariffa TaxID=183260 RepID=A0ABR2PIS9_9ROSI
MGNQETSKIVGIGNVILKTNTNCEIVLNDVRHVPDMRLNLISARKLDDAGYMNLFGGGKWKLTRNSMIVARGNKQGSLLRHISENGLQILAQKALIPEVKGKAIQPCIHCLAGKQHKVSFRRVNKRIVRSRDIVFLEDQTIEDTKQSGSPVSKAITQIIQDPVPVIRHETIEE